jgi:hypothetical protein
MSSFVTAVGAGKKKECLIKRHGNALPVRFLVYFGVLLFSENKVFFFKCAIPACFHVQPM